MNLCEAESLKGLLTGAGWEELSGPGEADLVVINTCSVRTTAENRIRGRLGFYKGLKESRPFLLAVMGCMTQRLGRRFRKDCPWVDILIGTFGKTAFVQALLENRVKTGDDFLEDREYPFIPAPPGSFKAFLPIMHGCDNFCSYCIVPFVRGREVSRSSEEIIREARRLSAQGVQELTLLGQNVNSYREGEMDFAGLLRGLLRETGIPWIRFLSPHPKDLSPRLIDLMAGESRICRHLHLPVQHGSDRILKAMNRGYTASGYLALTEELRRRLPGLGLTTDFLIGFPGETPEDFQAVLDLAEKVRFEDAFTYYYNPIEGTAAFGLPDQIPEAEKKRRLALLIEFQKELSRGEKQRYLGVRTLVLGEGLSRLNVGEVLARTEQNNMLIFKGGKERIGRFSQVAILSLRGNTLAGEAVNKKE
jgi:tRNA-2-methylthio-N6-dimethylallyladenosine synthase